MRHKKLLLGVLALLLVCCSVSCNGPAEETKPIELNPITGAASKEQLEITLYFGNSSYRNLVGETRTLDVPVNERLETVVVQELISGPKNQSSEALPLINPNTQVVNVDVNGDVLFVVLSNDFLDWSFIQTGQTAEETQKRAKYLAAYSIVNTLVEVSEVSRVQLLVDTDNSGTGQRIRRDEVGFNGDGILEPLGRNGGIVLTPYNTMVQLFEALTSRDFATAYSFIAYSDTTNGSKPDVESFTATMQEAASLESYAVGDVIVGPDGTTAVAMVDYAVRQTGEEIRARENVPIGLMKENDVWKIEYSTFQKIVTSS